MANLATRQPASSKRASGTGWRLWLVAAVSVLGATACGSAASGGGPAGGAGHGQTTPATSSASPTGSPAVHIPTPASNAAAGRYACTLIPAHDAATAVGLAVRKGQPSPGVGLQNGATGGGCDWTDSAGGTVTVVILTYPSAAIALRLGRSSAQSAEGVHARTVRLPDLAPFEHADTGTYGSTKLAEAFMVNGNHELDVSINDPASGPGSRLSVRAFVVLVQQVARAWQ
jgi:hypothetical protein